MLWAVWLAGGFAFRRPDAVKKKTILVAVLLIAPWLFYSIFFGMGPPPATAAGWVATSIEQQTRYTLLIAGGIFCAVGFSLLRLLLHERGEQFYAQAGYTAILIALPLFILNMCLWGYFLPEAFKHFVVSGAPAARPDWYRPIQMMFGMVSTVEVGLIYLATAAFAASFRKTRWFSKGACNAYIVISLFCCLLNFIPPSFPAPWSIMSFIVSVPAIPFLMPYLMGVRVLGKVGNEATVLSS
jgi:hypothetical protein